MKKRTVRARPIGRPPAGQSGEKVQHYPQVSVRLPRVVKQKLQALVVVRKQPQWRLIVDALECYLRDLPAHERRLVDTMVSRKH